MDSLLLAVELLLLVPDLFDVRDVADLVAVFKSSAQVRRAQPNQKCRDSWLDRYLNMAADVSMLSSIVRMRDGCKVQSSYRSCSGANMHSLMLACKKWRFKIDIGKSQRGPAGHADESEALRQGPAAEGKTRSSNACGRRAQRTPQAKEHARSCTRHKGRISLPPIRWENGPAEKRTRARRVRANLEDCDQRVHVHFAAAQAESLKARCGQMGWQRLCDMQRKQPRCAPSSEAVHIERLLERPLVIIQHAQVRDLAPELANEECKQHEGGQATRRIE